MACSAAAKSAAAGSGDAAERGRQHRPIGGWRRAHRGGQGLDGLRREDLGGVGGGDGRGVPHTGIGIGQQRDDLPDQRRRFEAAHRPHSLGPHAGTGVLEAFGEDGLGLDAQLARVLDLQDPRRQRALRENGGDRGPADQEDDGREQSEPGWHSPPVWPN